MDSQVSSRGRHSFSTTSHLLPHTSRKRTSSHHSYSVSVPVVTMEVTDIVQVGSQFYDENAERISNIIDEDIKVSGAERD
jgi:hypothetical protein